MLRVNNNDLPEGVDVENSVIRTTLTQGAIGYAKLNATTGYQIVGVIRQENGRFPPLGVNVTDKATGKDVGPGRGRRLRLSQRYSGNSILHLTWGDNTCEVTPPNQSNISESAIFYLVKQSNNSG
mgnify:CR=1 FL=1